MYLNAQSDGAVPIEDAPWWLLYLDSPPGWPKPWDVMGEAFHPIWLHRRLAYLSARAEGIKDRPKQNGS